MLIRPAAAIGLIALATAVASPASAAITCRGDAQLVAGNYIVTPYCQDKLLTLVARQFGVKVSFAEIRDNPNTKRDVCRLIGRDIRVQDACRTVNPNGRRF